MAGLEKELVSSTICFACTKKYYWLFVYGASESIVSLHRIDLRVDRPKAITMVISLSSFKIWLFSKFLWYLELPYFDLKLDTSCALIFESFESFKVLFFDIFS